MDRRVTPPKRATSPTWGSPPPCKQALKEFFPVSSDFFDSDIETSIFLEQIFTRGIILNETAKTKSLKIY